MATLSELSEAVNDLNRVTEPEAFRLIRNLDGTFNLARERDGRRYYLGDTKALALHRMQAWTDGFSAGIEASLEFLQHDLADAGG